MREFSAWSLSLGRWCGVYIRLHAFFILFGVFTLFMAASQNDTSMVSYCVFALGILLASVLVHELGHCYAAIRVGGYPEELVLAPLGGLTEVPVPHNPFAERSAAAGGPAANLLVALICLPVLLAREVPIVELLNPLRPTMNGMSQQSWLAGVSLTFWINWALVIFNLLPAFPFDGGRLLRSIVWPRLGNYRAAAIYVARSAQLVAVAMVIAAVLLGNGASAHPVPLWVPLVLLAIFLFFGAKQQLERLTYEAADGTDAVYDLSSDYLGLTTEVSTRTKPQRQPGRLARWLEKRREFKRRQQELLEAQEEQLADAVLARVHNEGIHAITPEDRDLLERVSKRYRQRHRG